MKKQVRNAFSALLAASVLTGCGSTTGPREAYTGTWWKRNLRGYWYVLQRDATDVYRGIDRHFFNYDWDDPNLQ
jgi:hypothetical protein